jgi:uncharacterized lipoprotein YbaY
MKQLKITSMGSFLAFCSLLAACSGKDSQANAAPVSLSDAPTKLVAAYCAGYGNCCASKGFAFNATVCDANASSQVSPDTICPAPGVYDPQAGGNCIAELQAALSTCSSSGSATSACDRMCNGNVAPGAACNRNSDCALPANGTVSCALADASSTTTVCIVRTRGKAGDACSETCTETADGNGLGCSMSIAAGTASPPTSSAASCYTNDSLYCTSSFVCQPLIAIGSACGNSDVCVDGAYCDFTTTRCAAKIAAGASCSGGASCVTSAYCTTAQVCASKKAAGAACQNYDECIGFCDTNTQLCVSDSTTTNLDVTAASCANPTPE